GIRDATVTGVQTCALPILASKVEVMASRRAGLPPFASSTSCVAVDFSAAIERVGPKHDRNVMPTTESHFRWRAEGCIGSLRRGRSEERRVGKEVREGGWRA